MAIVQLPPEYRQRRGLRTNAQNAAKATRRAVRYSAVATWRAVSSRGREEVLLGIGAGAVTFVVLPSDSDLPRLVAAFAVPLGSLLVVCALIFLGLLLWTPIEDHRKLVSERDDARDERDANREEVREWMSRDMDRSVKEAVRGDEHRAEIRAIKEEGERQVRTAEMRAALRALNASPPDIQQKPLPRHVMDNWLREIQQTLVRGGRTDLARALHTEAGKLTGADRFRYYLERLGQLQNEEAH